MKHIVTLVACTQRGECFNIWYHLRLLHLLNSPVQPVDACISQVFGLPLLEVCFWHHRELGAHKTVVLQWASSPSLGW